MKNVKYGKCVKCGKTYAATPDLTTCECGGAKDVAMAAFTAVTQGIIVTGVSAYAKQIISRMSKK